MKTEPKNILIVRTDRIGDLILTIPLAESIKTKYPNCKVYFLIREYTKPLTQNHPFIDGELILPENINSDDEKVLISEIKKLKIDTAICVYPRYNIAKILFKANVNNRVGSGYRWYSFLFNKKVFEHRKSGNNHEIEQNFKLLEKIGINKKITPANVAFNLQVEPNSEQKVKVLLSKNNYDFSKKTVIIHPGSGGSAVDWPFSNFMELVNLMARHLNTNIIITGSKLELEMCAELKISDKIINTAGLLNLSELMGLIKNSNLLIANSTGPIHIAAAFGKNVIGFYPNFKEASPVRWGPYSNLANVFTPNENCDGSTREKCEANNCMSTIKVEDVFDSVVKMFRNSPES